MYIPTQFKQEDKHVLIQVIKELKFGALIIFAENRFFTAHIPFLVKEEVGNILLECHVSRGNDIWQVVNSINKAMVIFQGAHTYIHPGWYPTKEKTGKVVPTYHYQVVHCHGYAEKESSETWLLKHIQELTDTHEKEQTNPWHVSDAPETYIQTMVKGIVGIRFYVEHIEGALKMGQHHVEENRLGVIENLGKSCQLQDQEVCKIMRDMELNKCN